MKIRTIFPYLLLTGIIAGLLFSPSCANTGAAPSGGYKDTLPPILLHTIPKYNTANFSGKRIELKFNEFIKLADASNQIFLSPPQAKRPQATVRGKSVIVTFPAPLDSATTYSLHFGQSITDNNEGNPYGAYSFSFSTGNKIDSILFSGYVADAQTLLPLENISIMLHTQFTDTTISKTLPRALAKTDLWGYFTVLNLKEIPYHAFAVEDLNRNNKYDAENERVAFLDSLVIPKNVMVPDSFAMERVNPKDTLKMLARPVEHTFYVFKENPKRQLLRDKVRPQARFFYLTFSAPNVVINSLQIEGVDSLNLIREHTLRRDTLRYWLQGAHIPDTLKGVVNYMKTDSLNQLSPAEEKFSLTVPKAQPAEQDNTRNSRQQADAKKEREDLLKITLTAKPEFVEQDGIVFHFSAYPIEFDPDQIKFTYISSRKEEIKVPFVFQKDSLNGCRYTLIPEKWIPATSYELKIPQGIFKDVYGYLNDSIVQKVTLPEAGKTGAISFTLDGGEGHYIVELLSQTKDQVLRSLHIPAGGKGVFPYLADGMYALRITEDRNGNGVWDTGSLTQGLQPERVRFFMLANGLSLLEIKDKRELDQTIDIEELFHHDIAPAVPTKTKK